MSEFSDRPLVADSITGLRSFRVDSLGRLTGVSYQRVWRPGVNEASCHDRSAVGTLTFGGVSLTNYITSFTFGTDGDDGKITASAKPASEPVEHQVASLDCTCGFYAYTDRESNPYHAMHEGVLGIVRGSGVATVGRRGFRAERAEIVALVDPGAGPSRWDLFSVRAEAGGWGGATAGLSVFALAATVMAFTSASPLLGVVPAIVALFCLAFTVASLHGIGIDLREGVGFAAVRRAYPDIPVFRTESAAIEAFPLSTPPAPEPSDEDFWTRSAS